MYGLGEEQRNFLELLQNQKQEEINGKISNGEGERKTGILGRNFFMFASGSIGRVIWSQIYSCMEEGTGRVTRQ